MMNKTELRELLSSDIEVRSDENSRTIQGYAVKWGKKSHKIANRFVEQFQKGAFSETLANDEQRALWSHDNAKVLGRTKNNTLRLSEDDIGLRFELDLPNTTLGNDALESVKRGDIDGVSFGFRALEQDWENRSRNDILRNVKKANLFEISLVGVPAYEDSEVSLRGYNPFKSYSEERSRRKRLLLKTYL